MVVAQYRRKFRAIPHKERLATLHAICVQIFRHIAEKSDNAPYAQALCGVAVAEYPKSPRKNRQFCQLFVQQKYDKIKETPHRAVRRDLCSVSYGYSGTIPERVSAR